MELKNTTFAFLALALFGCQEQKYVPVTTFQEAEDPVAISTEAEQQWNQAGKKLNVAWGSIDWRYSRSEIPQNLETNLVNSQPGEVKRLRPNCYYGRLEDQTV